MLGEASKQVDQPRGPSPAAQFGFLALTAAGWSDACQGTQPGQTHLQVQPMIILSHKETRQKRWTRTNNRKETSARITGPERERYAKKKRDRYEEAGSWSGVPGSVIQSPARTVFSPQIHGCSLTQLAPTSLQCAKPQQVKQQLPISADSVEQSTLPLGPLRPHGCR